MSGTGSQQWLRACSLVVGDQTGAGIELAGVQDQVLRIRFTVSYYISSTPALLHARVYNLSTATRQQIVGLASKGASTTDTSIAFATSAQVILQAGYQGSVGKVFKGQVYQLRQGYENSTDSYLDIFAADGDMGHTYDIANTTFAKGYSAVDKWNYHNQTLSKWGLATGDPPTGLPTTQSPRGSVVFGSTRERMDDLGQTYNFNWNILDGQVQALPKFSFRPGAAIKINSLTGQIGFPEQTDQGVMVTCLMNPALRWGTRVVLDNKEISQFLIKSSGTAAQSSLFPNVPGANQYLVSGNPLNPEWIPPIDADGNYVVVWAEHTGDTRGTDWYTKFSCISVDPSAPVPQATNNVAPPPRNAP